MSKKASNVSVLVRKDAPQPEELAAKQNIALKLSVIKDWLDNGIPLKSDEAGMIIRDDDGEAVFDYFPSSIQQFLKWNSSQNCKAVHADIIDKFGHIRGTGRDTLNRYDDLYEQVASITDALKNQSKKQYLQENKASQIEQLKEEIVLLKKARELSEIKHRQAMQEINALKSELNDEIKQHASSRKLWASDIQQLQSEIDAMSSENRVLTRKLVKIAPIKKVVK